MRVSGCASGRRCGSSRPRATPPTGSVASRPARPTAIAARRRCSSPPHAAGALSGAPGRVDAIGVIGDGHIARRSCVHTCNGMGAASTCSTTRTAPTPTPAIRARPTAKPGRHLRGPRRDRRHRRVVRRRRHVRSRHRPAPARDRRAARAGRHAAPGPPADRRGGAILSSCRRARPLAGRPLARHRRLPRRPWRRAAWFELGHSWIPLAAAIGGGIGMAQLAVIAAARRAGRVRPAEALREVAIEHAVRESSSCSAACSAWPAEARWR